MKKTNQLRITDTTLRDGHQSLWATRMRTADIMGIIDVIDNAGYYSLEVWGGATFDVCLRFLYEDPWERLRMIKSKARKTPLQMLLRGQNIVGYKNYPDDLVDRFVESAHVNGIDIFRVFDALNDTRNLEAAVRAVKKYGAHAQGTLSYTISPAHTIEKYVQYAKEQQQLGIDSLCIKDMAGILAPVQSGELVAALSKEIDVPIQVHCHATSGMAVAAYLEGVRAGAGAIDCAIASMAGFSSQPPVETIHAIFSDTEYDTGLDQEALRTINKYFADLTPQRSKGRGFEAAVDSEILVHQIPGGMISNFRSQLEQQGALDKLPEALTEVSLVRKDLGYPPLVTPTSQIVGTQAVMNVLTGERYKLVPDEVKKYVKGLYGRPPVPMDKVFVKRILGKDKPVDHRPADDLQPILQQATRNISDPKLLVQEEDILSYCLFPEVATNFFKWRALPEGERPMSPADQEWEAQQTPSKEVTDQTVKPGEGNPATPLLHASDYEALSGLLEKASHMQLNELMIRKGEFQLSLVATNGKMEVTVPANPVKDPVKEKQAETVTKTTRSTGPVVDLQDTIDAVMAGTFYITPEENAPPFVKDGTVVNKGDVICILEAMKLFNQIQAPFKCRIISVLIESGAKVTKGQPIMAVEKL